MSTVVPTGVRMTLGVRTCTWMRDRVGQSARPVIATASGHHVHRAVVAADACATDHFRVDAMRSRVCSRAMPSCAWHAQPPPSSERSARVHDRWRDAADAADDAGAVCSQRASDADEFPPVLMLYQPPTAASCCVRAVVAVAAARGVAATWVCRRRRAIGCWKQRWHADCRLHSVVSSVSTPMCGRELPLAAAVSARGRDVSGPDAVWPAAVRCASAAGRVTESRRASAAVRDSDRRLECERRSLATSIDRVRKA